MAKPRRRARWEVTNFEGWWWAQSLRKWVKLEDLVGKVGLCSHASFRTSVRAYKYARLCPANEVLVTMIPREGREKEKMWYVRK